MKTLLALAATVVTSVAGAAPLYCSGTINALYVANDGAFVLSGTWRNDYTMICHLRQPWNGVSPETCAFWYGLLVTSKTNAKNVTINYDTAFLCTTLPTYANSPGPSYVMQN